MVKLLKYTRETYTPNTNQRKKKINKKKEKQLTYLKVTCEKCFDTISFLSLTPSIDRHYSFLLEYVIISVVFETLLTDVLHTFDTETLSSDVVNILTPPSNE